MSQTKPLPSFEDRSLADRYCDLILTGGVTSAVAYPGAICTLATAYRFNSLGGASSGAGAAALAAAAEYRRRHGSPEGFRLLIERMSDLRESVDGRTGLEWLFQPGRRKTVLFDALVPWFARPGGKVGRLVWDLLRSYGALPLAAAGAITWLLCRALADQGAQWAGPWAGVAGTIVFCVAWGWVIWRDLKRVVADDFGLCSGLERRAASTQPALTEWLHNLIQEVAGRLSDDAPLTFADLATAPGSPQAAFGTRGQHDEASINLRVFTANVTHRRPYLFPQPEPGPGETEEPRLYFRPAEMRKLFPSRVVEHMVAVAQTEGLPCPQAVGPPDLLPLPRMQLPIVVAARMSVSFPVLFMAVPLWSVDRRDPARPGEPPEGVPTFRRCLFADGGLCSNFPIHLFDSPVPAWPTFGLSLDDLPELQGEYRAGPDVQKKRMTDSIRLPTDHRQGAGDHWPGLSPVTPWGRLATYIGDMFITIKNWNDATLSRMPGVRDRVVRVGLPPGIGGLNIRMTGDQIRVLAEVGGEAAHRLLERYAIPAGPHGVAQGWSEHRWVRFNTLCLCLTNYLSGLSEAAGPGRFSQALAEQIREAVDAAPLVGDEASRLLPAQAAALEGLLAALIEAERALRTAASSIQPYQPVPQPDLRVRPPL